MRVTMKHGGHAIPVDRFLESARPEVRKDLHRFAFDGTADWRVVQHRDARLRAQASERGFELQRLVDSLLDEQLDRLFAPGSERAATEPAGESLDARESDALDFGGPRRREPSRLRR
jgi:hypothetical protein